MVYRVQQGYNEDTLWILIPVLTTRYCTFPAEFILHPLHPTSSTTNSHSLSTVPWNSASASSVAASPSCPLFSAKAATPLPSLSLARFALFYPAGASSAPQVAATLATYRAAPLPQPATRVLTIRYKIVPRRWVKSMRDTQASLQTGLTTHPNRTQRAIAVSQTASEREGYGLYFVLNRAAVWKDHSGSILGITNKMEGVVRSCMHRE